MRLEALLRSATDAHADGADDDQDDDGGDDEGSFGGAHLARLPAWRPPLPGPALHVLPAVTRLTLALASHSPACRGAKYFRAGENILGENISLKDFEQYGSSDIVS